MYVRSLCSLSTLIVCTVVSQVTLLSSYNSKAIVSLLCSLPILIDCVEVSLLCSLPTTVYVTVSSVVHQVALLPSNNSLRYSEQYLLYVRSLCSLPTLIVCTVVSQVALLSSYNSKATVSLLFSLPVPIYLNFS